MYRDGANRESPTELHRALSSMSASTMRSATSSPASSRIPWSTLVELATMCSESERGKLVKALEKT